MIVPTRNRAAQLRICLESLARLDFPRDRFEVIVVDDGGAEPLDSLLASFRGAIEVTFVRQDWAGPAAARNLGAARARGDLLAFTDDDCAPRRDWLSRIADRHRARREEAIGGLTVNALEANRYSTAAQMLIDAGYEQQNHESSAFPFFTTNNLAVPVERFRQLEGFDATYITSEDRQFCARWARRGWRIAYEPEAVVEHSHPLTFWTFCRLHFAYGRGAFQFRAEQARQQHPVPFEPAYYLGTLPRHAFAGRSPIDGLILLSLLVPWHMANAAGFCWQWLRGVRGRTPDA